MPSLDLYASLIAFTLLCLGALGYLLRLALAGAAHYARVNAAGGTALLGRSLMEFGYWCLQPLGRACVRAKVTANQITAVSLLLGACSGLSLALGHFGLGALFATVSGLGDVLDGLVARETGTVTPGGAIFDASVDRYTEFFLLAGIGFYERASGPLLAIAMFGLLGSFMISYGSAKAESLHVPVPRGMMRRAERVTYLCGGLLLSPVAGLLVGSGRLPAWAAQAPMIAGLVLVALVSNIEAARRLRVVALGAMPVKPAAPIEPVRAEAKVVLSVVGRAPALSIAPAVPMAATAPIAVTAPPAMLAASGANEASPAIPLRLPQPASQR